MNIRNCLPILAALGISGCTGTLQTAGDAAPVTAVAPAKASFEQALFAKLASQPAGSTITTHLPDGRETLLLIVDNYRAASGKDCTSALEVAHGVQHVMCRDDTGEVNHIRLGSR